MRLLLDTHILLWWALGDTRLSKNARELIANMDSECVVSVAAVWEISIKSGLERGLPSGVTGSAYADLIDEAGFRLLDVRRPHALGVEQLPRHHGDPFDRLMISQAIAEQLVFLTHDQALAAYGDFVRIV